LEFASVTASSLEPIGWADCATGVTLLVNLAMNPNGDESRDRLMKTRESTLPRSGPLPQPSNPSEAQEYLKAEAFPAPDVQTVTLTATEFTSVCPRTGQPDFGTVTIEYTPGERCLESKALKYYLWSFRNEGAFCEALAARIADDVVDAIAPRALVVRVTQNVRGGIALVAVAQRPAAGSR
jgi:7-cyano-7-deazaguanine reductase